jgi:hypothetical protein
LLLGWLGFSVVNANRDVMMMKKGFPRTFISSISLIMMPFSVLFNFAFSFIAKPHREMKIQIVAGILNFANGFYFYQIYTNYEGLKDL